MTERKPKLMFFVTEDWYFVSHRLPLAQTALAAGYDVSLVTRVGDDADTIRDSGIRLYPLDIHRSGGNPFRETRTFLELKRIYAHEKPDIVHHVAMKPVVYGSLAARMVGVKGVVNALAGMGFVFSSSSRKARWLKPLVRRVLKYAVSPYNARLILQNTDDVRMFGEEGLIDPALIRLIRGSGVDPSSYPAVPENNAGLPLVVLPARLLRDKGVLEFVDAARILRQRGVAARFALVGEPDPLNPASFNEEDILSWQEEGLVECWGWRDDVAAVFAQANIVCLPSYREGLPKALLEAAASGRAIVATDVPGCREIVRDGVNGWLVPPRDPAALAAALHEAIRRPDLRSLYGRKARAVVEREFSLELVGAETLGIYAELTGKI